MKIKLAALICIMMLLLAVLAGCGAESAETTAATIETTAAPTELQTFFEEQGLQAWEGFTVEESADVREIHATGTIPDAMEVFFYKSQDHVEEILHKEIIEVDVDVHIAAYYADEFNMERISDVVNSFYQKNVEDGETVTKEEWLAAHEDYVVYNYWTRSEANTSMYIDDFLSSRDKTEEYGWTASWDNITMMDRNTGNVFYSYDDTDNILGRFPVITEDETSEILVFYNHSSFWQDAETSERDNLTSYYDLYIMAPKDYDGLAFAYGAFLDYDGTDEEILARINDEENDETSKWEQMTYQEYKEKYDYLTNYFFVPTELDEQDTRPATTVGTFFDKMGIDSNMEKFEIWETVSDSGVKETIWYNSTAIPGAEIQYYNASKRSAKNYVDKKLANCMIRVQAREYWADQFAIEDIQDIMNSFYEADNTDISKEQWLQEHQNHKLVHFFTDTEFWASNATNQFFSNHNGHHWWWASTMWNKLIDKYTGEVFMPQNGSDGVVETFTVNDIDFSVMNMQSKHEWHESATGYSNLTEWYDMYVLLPADYDGLTFAMVLYEKTRSDEEILALYNDSESPQSSEETEEDPSTWWSGEFYEEESYLKRYYFTTAK